MAPRMHQRKLPATGAQTALNMDMNATVLRPMRGVGEYEQTQGDPIRTLYHYYIPDTPETRDAGIDPETHDVWFTWPYDVDVAKGQIAADAFGWIFFTGEKERGDYLKATYAYLDVNNLFEHRFERPRTAVNFFIPPPENELTTEISIPAGGTFDPQDVAETRVYTYTRVYKSIHGYEVESPPACASEPIDLPFVDAVDDEGNPTLRPAPVKLTGFTLYDETPHDFYMLAHHRRPWPAASGFWLGNLRYRIYRSVGGVFLLVHEHIVDTSEGAPEFVEFIDDVQTMDILNTPLPSADWDNPPQAMRGLINMPNGIMAGFKGYDVYFCEPYHPHAWPRKYVLTVDAEVVGLGVMDTTLVILTRGTPYFAQGSHPESMTLVRGQMNYPCASKRSIVNLENAVYFSSYDGLIRLMSSGGTNLTREIIEPWDWKERFVPEKIQAYAHRAQYVAFYGDDRDFATGTDLFTQGQGFVYDMVTNRMGFHAVIPGVRHDISAGHRDEKNGLLHIAGRDGNTFYIVPWDAEPNPDVRVYWGSKEFELPFPAGFGWGQVYCSEYPIRVRVQADNLYAQFPATDGSGETTTVYEVQSALPFRLPVLHGRTWTMHISGYAGSVFLLVLAQSSAELKEE